MTEILTAYFAERERSGGRFLAEAMLDHLAERGVQTSVMLRGIASFGSTNIIRTDRTLTLSEDPPVAITAVDTAERIGAVAEEVAAMTGLGLLTRELATSPPADGDVRLTFFVPRQRHRAVCDDLFGLGFHSAEVLLGVDGTTAGQRARARFFSHNSAVPSMVSGVGTAEAARAALARYPDVPATVQAVVICKQHGRAITVPPAGAAFAKLVLRTAEDDRHDGQAIHRALIRELKAAGGSGATVLRGVWGFHDGGRPHGDRFLQLARHVPVRTVIIDTPPRIAEAFTLVDALTTEAGLVTYEPVAAVLARHHGHSRGDLTTG